MVHFFLHFFSSIDILSFLNASFRLVSNGFFSFATFPSDGPRHFVVNSNKTHCSPVADFCGCH